jgi:hypothetical protein
MASKKIGRNQPCLCGSGRKFKKCHGSPQRSTIPPAVPPEVSQKLAELHALEKQREQQQGYGRPIISSRVGAFRFVAVGDEIMWSKNWKTFPDFLSEYMKRVFGGDWGNSELAKPAKERHLLLQWYEKTTRYINAHIKRPGEVTAMPSVGVVSAYLSLAYSLYLIAHNQSLQQALIRRLKHPEQFLPAYYETLVFGTLIRAGFDLQFEDETDASRSHCEVTATFRATGKQFSVEAKMRQETTVSLDVGRQLKKALKKEADHTRIVFIEANIPEQPDEANRVKSLDKILADIRKREAEAIHQKPPPPAYVVVTNHPYLYYLEQPVTHWALVEGFQLPDFGWGRQFTTLREAVAARDKHREMFALMKSWEEHNTIPSTFEGEIPELEFGESHVRLIIGQQYEVPEGGNTVVAQLVDAVVFESDRSVIGFYRTREGKNIIEQCPLTDDEFAAYKRHPETFFGRVKAAPKKNLDPIELYDWLYESYRHNSKERLLELLSGAPDMESLRKLSRDELVRTFSERTVYALQRA